MTPIKQEKQLTIPLVRFLHYLIGSPTNPMPIEIEPIDAILISHIDADEEFCHVEVPSLENRLIKPRVWWINRWREDYNRILKLRQKAAEDRLEANKRAENADRLAKSFVKKTGIDYATALSMAKKLAANKDTIAAQVLEVELDL